MDDQLSDIHRDTMKTKIMFMAACVNMILLIFPVRAAEKIQIVTTHEPPYQIVKENELTGVSTEIIRLMLKELGMHAEIQPFPWARAYRLALENKNTMIFTILRNKQREKLFKWVGSLFPFEVYFYKLVSRKEIVVNTLEDAKKYQVGLMRDDSRAIYLQSQGFTNVQLVVADAQNIQKLFLKRIDLLPSDPIVLAYNLKETLLDRSNIEKVYHINGAGGENYVAFSNETDDRVVEKYRRAFNKIKQSKQYQLILKKYLE